MSKKVVSTSIKTPLLKQIDNYHDKRTIVSRNWREFKVQCGTHLVWKTKDGHTIETGIYAHPDKKTRVGVEIATQIGCSQKCIMCASGSLKSVRNLSTEEMLAQVELSLAEEEIIPNTVKYSFFISAMGIGEPSLNANNVSEAFKKIRTWYPKADLNISTNGTVPKAIFQWSDEIIDPFHLQLSLHAPNSKIRGKIIPSLKNVSIEPVLEAIDYFHRKHPNSKIWIIYTPLKNINDFEKQIDELLKNTLYSRRGYLTLKFLMLNETSFSRKNNLCSPEIQQVRKWVRRAKYLGYHSPYVWQVKSRIACGQLVKDKLKDNQ